MSKNMSLEQIIANGNKSHMTKAEMAERKKQEEQLQNLKSDKIKPPKFLSKDGKKIFKKIVIDLQEANLYCNVDVYGLAILSESIDKFIHCTIALHGEELSIEHTNKAGFSNYIENPIIKTQLKYAEMVKKFSSDYGLSPASRLKIMQSSTPEGDELEEEFEGIFEYV